MKNKKNKNKHKIKKVLNGNDLSKDSQNISNKIKDNYNEKIQSFISILFTIIIFFAFILLIIVLYNNYFKTNKNDNINIDKEELCKEYIKKDYGIKDEDIKEFIKENRGLIYNIKNFDSLNITNEDLIDFATYFIWSSEGEYLTCENDDFCLVSYKKMELNALKQEFKKYLDIKDLTLLFPDEFKSQDDIRMYQVNDEVILTFNEFLYQTLRHEIIDILIDEDNVKIIFALTNQINDTTYNYQGYKTLNLKYKDKRFVITELKTSLYDK